MTSTYDSTGVVLDRYADIVARYKVLAEAEWGASIDTEEDGFLGHVIRNTSLVQAEMNEIIQSIYDAISVANSTGAQLFNLIALVGILRQSAAFSTVTLTLTATIATTVPVGSRYSTTAGIIFATDEALVFAGAGSDTVDATCTIVGANNAAIAEVTTILTAVHGISAVTNAAAAVPGRLQETSAQGKARHTAAVATSGEDDVASIYEAVGAVSGVSAVYVSENDTAAIVDGVPANSIHVSVVGGSDDDVAEAISNNKTASVTTYGPAEAVTVYNETTNQSKVINFDRAVDTPVFVAVTITKSSGVYPEDGDALMKAALVASFTDKRIAANVIFTELYAPIYSVTGHFVTNLQLGLVFPAAGTADLAMTTLKRATLPIANITITETV